ncbi:ATP-dependent Zn protease [Ochrobactrum tritici]|uniref:ATP-dependent Zn protease n=1 Tax=Brucella tritici TaxID=94626 RepID=A0A7X6FPW0_9HYPH|nr:ATP-dependent Zn protease [Brucella tritici]
MTGCKSDERLKSLRDLRPLALKAQGMTGADIERIARQARQQARRTKRQLTWTDIEKGIVGNRRAILPEERWRMAVHEAGHALIRHILQVGHPLTLSIEEQVGFGFATERRKLIPLEKDCEDNLAVMLAGRAAEELVLGDVSVGSGMRPGSDLANATDLALAMETTYGFARERPLLFCDGVARRELLHETHPITSHVDERLQKPTTLPVTDLSVTLKRTGRLPRRCLNMAFWRVKPSPPFSTMPSGDRINKAVMLR